MNVLLEVFPKNGHVPITSLNNGLLFVFPDYLAPDDLKTQDFEAVDRHFADLSKRYGIPLQAHEKVIFDMCYTPMRSKNYSEAIELFKVLLERYPATTRERFFLGEAYRSKGELMQAENMYKKCLDLDPDFQRANARLESLHEKK